MAVAVAAVTRRTRRAAFEHCLCVERCWAVETTPGGESRWCMYAGHHELRLAWGAVCGRYTATLVLYVTERDTEESRTDLGVFPAFLPSSEPRMCRAAGHRAGGRGGRDTHTSITPYRATQPTPTRACVETPDSGRLGSLSPRIFFRVATDHHHHRSCGPYVTGEGRGAPRCARHAAHAQRGSKCTSRVLETESDVKTSQGRRLGGEG